MKKQYDMKCNIAQTLNMIGDKWTLLILHAIKEGCHTYKSLQQCLHGIPTNLLSERLKSLCEDDLLICNLYSSHPPRYEYHLTEKSEDLDDILNAFLLWGDKHLNKSYTCLKHKTCGSPVHIAYVCNECGKIIQKDDILICDAEDHEKKDDSDH